MKMMIGLEIGDDDRVERLQRVAHVDDAFAFIHDFREYLRTQERKVNPENRDGISAMRNNFNDMLLDSGIVLDTLYT